VSAASWTLPPWERSIKTTNGIFGSHMFSGFGELGLGLVNLDTVRSNMIQQNRPQSDIDNVMFWAQKLNVLQQKIGDSAARNSTTDATFAHYVRAINAGVKLTPEQQAAMTYEAQQANRGSTSRDVSPGGSTLVTSPPHSGKTLLIGGAVALLAVGGLIAWKSGAFGKKSAAAA
jgi:hypothetical protein